MKSVYVRRTAAALAALLMTTGTMVACEKGSQAGEETGEAETYTYRTDVSAYLGAMNTTDTRYLKLVNKTHPVDASYGPAALTTMDKSMTLGGKTVQLEAGVALAAEAMVKEMWAYGWKDILITSGHRTYSYQSSLFNTYLGQEKSKHPTWTVAQIEAEVLTYSAKPGTSEHQTGLCMDLIVNNAHPVLDETFADHPAYAWLQANAHKFGFILRFPQGKEGVTGYSYEPWHYRFVGIETATKIHEAGLTLEEYLERAGN